MLSHVFGESSSIAMEYILSDYLLTNNNNNELTQNDILMNKKTRLKDTYNLALSTHLEIKVIKSYLSS